MRTLSLLACSLLAIVAVSGADPAAANTLSAKEQADGWKLLFDGTSLDAWRGYKKETVPDGWKAVNGTLSRVGGGGDLATKEQFESFDLVMEWQIAPGGNSGVMYHVTEERGAPYETGPEMQVLDNAKHGDGKNPKTSAGACYALYPPVKDVTKPAGEWNQARLLVDNNKVEHWLNGTKLCEYELGSEDWKAKVKASKFAAWDLFGTRPKGHIVLQDHGDLVAYRNIKIKVLPTKAK